VDRRGRDVSGSAISTCVAEPLIDLEAVREPQGSRTEGGLTVESRTLEHGWRSRA
jgi:hypothetical protein